MDYYKKYLKYKSKYIELNNRIHMIGGKTEITLKDGVLIVNFKGNKKLMNETLDAISNEYEGGVMRNREGHNFPSSFIPAGHMLSEYKDRCSYVLGIKSQESLPHELLHAKFYMDKSYRDAQCAEWNSYKQETRDKICAYIKRLGYPDSVIIDEYQAYKNTEKANFFGFKLL